MAFLRTEDKGCNIFIYFGNTRVNNEALTKDSKEDDTWWSVHYPVSTKNLRLIGTKGADTEFIVNFGLEPLTGRITIAAAVNPSGGYDSISASYFYYVNIEIDARTLDYKVEFPRLKAEVDMFGQPHYQVHNAYPHKVSWKLILFQESVRNLLTDAMFRAAYFILMDKGMAPDYDVRTFEGPIWSDEQGSLFKGASPFVPIELMVQQFGRIRYTEVSGLILSTSDAGGGQTNINTSNHGLSTDDWVTISGTEQSGLIVDAYGTTTTNIVCDGHHGLSTDDWVTITGTGGVPPSGYNGVWQITYVGDITYNINTAFTGTVTGNWQRKVLYKGHWKAIYKNVNAFMINTSFIGSDTGNWLRNEEITWGVWEN